MWRTLQYEHKVRVKQEKGIRKVMIQYVKCKITNSLFYVFFLFFGSNKNEKSAKIYKLMNENMEVFLKITLESLYMNRIKYK